MTTLINIPDTITEIRPVSQSDVILALAILLYVNGEVTLAKAAEILGITQDGFQKILSDKNIPLRYDLDDLHGELKTIQMFLANTQP